MDCSSTEKGNQSHRVSCLFPPQGYVDMTLCHIIKKCSRQLLISYGRFPFLMTLLFLFALPSSLIAEEPLHVRIDQLIEAAHPGPFSGAADDAEFMRRASLDLIGRIPSTVELNTFLNDKTANDKKRTQLIDQLLADSRHVQQLVYFFNNIFMERRTGKNIPDAEWLNYLRESFAANKPWDQLAKEILNADGTKEHIRPAAKFYLDREKFNIDLVTQDVGRVFLGRDMECAQCHDHPSVDDYLQRHYYGISAFLKRSYLLKDSKTKKMMLAEKAEGAVSFTSVFTSETGKTSPRILDLKPIDDPKGTEKSYIVKPAKNVRSVPKYSRHQQLGQSMISPDNLAFRRNIVNRLWAMMMGRGLVEPLDLLSSDNPSSHPKLLALLADEFLKHKYNINWMIRELALTKTYQRSSHPPVSKDTIPEKKYATGLLKPLTPEQLAWSLMIATGETEQQMLAPEKKKLKADPKKAEQIIKDPKWRNETMQNIKSLNSYVTVVVRMFSSPRGQKTNFEASADQALFMSNGTTLQRWIRPGARKLSQHLIQLKDDTKTAQELYLATLSRMPTTEETTDVIQYLKAEKNRPNAIAELIWSLLTSVEFRLNH